MKFCPTCRYYLYLKVSNEIIASAGESVQAIHLICHNCGYQEEDKGGGLIMETDLQEKTSEGYKILVNEFTKLDQTLPHLHTIKCPNAACASNTAGKEPDVIYMKYDAQNLKYIYLCNIDGCGARWRSKGA
jgi:DNA-directed RNA polymerase subunit M/transcription elongation factor TFIIS